MRPPLMILMPAPTRRGRLLMGAAVAAKWAWALLPRFVLVLTLTFIAAVVVGAYIAPRGD